MHQHPTDPALTGVLIYLVDEIKAARALAITPRDEYEMNQALKRSERRTHRLERLADALTKLDAQT